MVAAAGPAALALGSVPFSEARGSRAGTASPGTELTALGGQGGSPGGRLPRAQVPPPPPPPRAVGRQGRQPVPGHGRGRGGAPGDAGAPEGLGGRVGLWCQSLQNCLQHCEPVIMKHFTVFQRGPL